MKVANNTQLYTTIYSTADPNVMIKPYVVNTAKCKYSFHQDSQNNLYLFYELGIILFVMILSDFSLIST